MENKQDDYLHLIKKSINKINELKQELKIQKETQEKIAIVGMSCRFPGGCNTPEDFWEFIIAGGDGVIEVPKDRWDSEEFYNPVPNNFGKMYLKEAGFLQQNIGEFDAHFFGISPREAVEMDPQQRLLLEVCWEALERSGITANQLKGTQTGVFVGVIGSEYALLPRTNKNVNPYILTGSMSNIVSGRISYILGVQGPSISIDTACSSSLTAIHLACESLQKGESNLALAGGVNLMISPQGFVSLCELNALAKDGRCKTFDSSGDGYGRGEGCGVVVLKRLSDAVRDNDKILAVIRGTGINQDGPSSGLTVPNGSAQKDLICKTLEKANVLPNDVSYFELHGTGTSLGDPIEFQALSEVFNATNRKNPLILGSVKSNIGHLEGAAGIASLIKSVLSLQNKKIPPILHLKNVNPRINLKKIPAVIPNEIMQWEASETERIMGISSFGFSGSNAHLILSEAPEENDANREINGIIERPLQILALSAKNEKALFQLVDKYKRYFDKQNQEKLEDICFTANSGRVHFAHRITFIAENFEAMRVKLLEYLASNSEKVVVESVGKEKNKIVFLFNGKINKEISMYLFETQPVFKKVLLSCNKKFKELTNKSFLEDIKLYKINDSNNTPKYIDRIISFSVHFSLLKLWEMWGIKASTVTGYEEGEFTAACAAGIMTMETAMLYILENENLSMNTNIKKSLNKPHIRVISGTKGNIIDNKDATSDVYWKNIFSNKPQINERFKNIIQQGYMNFIEIGLNNELDDIVRNLDKQYLYFRINENPWESLTNAVSKLYLLGFDINWKGFDEGYIRHKVILPTYQFQKKYYWCDTMPFSDYLYVKTERNKDKKDFFEGKIFKSPLKEKQIGYSLNLETAPELADTEGVVHVGHFLEFLGRIIKKIYNSEFSVKYIEFLSPLMVMDNKNTYVTLILNLINYDEIEFSFYSAQEDENWSNNKE